MEYVQLGLTVHKSQQLMRCKFRQRKLSSVRYGFADQWQSMLCHAERFLLHIRQRNLRRERVCILECAIEAVAMNGLTLDDMTSANGFQAPAPHPRNR